MKTPSKVTITIPKKIWAGDQRYYSKWCWETYGRYLTGYRNEGQHPVELKIKFARW